MKYIDVLKESLQEADVTKTSDILGPMVEPILGYDGDGDLVTHKNASEILKKYYFENDSDGLVTLDDSTKSVTDGEPDQKKIDNVKKKIEDIIKSDEETNQPTEKTLNEMVSSLEDILLEESDDTNISESENNIDSKIELILREDSHVINQLENLLEEENASDKEEAKENDDKEKEPNSDDVLIDKDTKVKLEAEDNSDEKSGDNEDDSSDENKLKPSDEESDEKEEKTPLDIDKNIKEMDMIEEILQQESVSDAELLLNNIETILGEQNEIVPYESVDCENKNSDIDVDNPLSKKVTTESVEDSVLEWLIMEIEDSSVQDENIDNELVENEEIDESSIESDILKEAFDIFKKDDEINNDELDDFNISKIDPSKIRI